MTTKIESITVGDALPERTYKPSSVSLFLYNASIWNAHRIHYDEPYTTETEGHRAVVIDGPLQGDWLTQTVEEWLEGDGTMIEFEYSNRLASHLGDELTTGGTVKSVDLESGEASLELFVRNQEGQTTTPGRAVVRFHRDRELSG